MASNVDSFDNEVSDDYAFTDLTMISKWNEINYSNTDTNKGHINPTVVKLDSNKTQNAFGASIGNIFWNKAVTYPENIYCVKLTDDALFWVLGLQNGVIAFYPTEKQKETASITNLKVSSEKYPVTEIQLITFMKKNEASKLFLLATYASGFIRLWHYNSPNLRNRLIREWKEKFFETEIKEGKTECNNQILALSVSFDYQRFITGGDDHVIKVYEITGRNVLRNLYEQQKMMIQTGHMSNVTGNVYHHTMRITALKYHPLGKSDSNYQHIFVSGSWDNTIQIWDDRKEASLWVYDGPHVCGSDGIDINPLQNVILTCSWRRDKSLFQVWKFNEYIIGSSSIDNRALVTQFNLPLTEFHQDISQIPSQGYVASYAADGNYVFFGGSNQNIFKIVEVNNMTSLGVLYNLKHGVISSNHFVDNRKTRIALASGCNLLLVTLDVQRTVTQNISTYYRKESLNGRG